MTALDHVNALLRSRTAWLAVTAIALGMIAVSPAQAIVLTNLCNFTGGGCDMTQTASVTVLDPNTGLPLGGSTPLPNPTLTSAPTTPGGVTVTGTFGYTADLPGVNEYSLELVLNGTTAGVPLGTLGVTGLLDFDANPGPGGLVLGTQERFIVTQNGIDTEADFSTGIGANHGAGSAQIFPLDPTLPVTGWSMMFQIDWLTSDTSTLTVAFPLTEDPSPEPVSVLLVGSGIGLLALVRRWRKA